MKKNVGSNRLQSNLLQQNCFVRDVVRLDTDCSLCDQPSTYVSLDEVVSSDGVKLVETSNPYPITPDYVNSFAEGSEYRLDPLNALNNSVKRRNLGDVRGIQDISNMDNDQLVSLFEQLKSRFSSSAEGTAPANKSSAEGAAPANKSSGEVK